MILNKINAFTQEVKNAIFLFGEIALISAISVAIIFALLYIFYFPFKLHVKWWIFKRHHLMDEHNKNVHKIIKKLKLKVTDEKVVVSSDTNFANYTTDDDYNQLINGLPKELKKCFGHDFDDGKEDNYLTFTWTR